MATNKSGTAGVKLPIKQIPDTMWLVWIDARIDLKDPHYKQSRELLDHVAENIVMFHDIDSCMKFLRTDEIIEAVIISSGALGETLARQIQSTNKIDSIYLFCASVDYHQQWAKKFPIIKGVYNSIVPICLAIQDNILRIKDDESISILKELHDGVNIVTDLLEPSFMYTKLLKKIFLEMEGDGVEARRNLVRYAREKNRGETDQLKIIEEFQAYQPKYAIWWYTRECFTYKVLNEALRFLQADLLVLMGFFIRDLHFQIAALHEKQYLKQGGKVFNRYRGQFLSHHSFEKLKTSRNGLISFNNFLSTSQERGAAEKHILDQPVCPNMVRVIFVMNIDPTKTSAVFADISEISYYKKEREDLFSMNTVFRIGPVTLVNKEKHLFEIQLSLISDDDKDLNALTAQMEKEIRGETPERRLGKLLIKLGEVNKAEELYVALLKQAGKLEDQAYYNHQLGWIKDDQNDPEAALKYYREVLKIEEKIFAPNDLSLAVSYNNIGLVYANMKKYEEALSYHQKALAIEQKHRSSDDILFAATYNNLGTVHLHLKQYPEALKFFERTRLIEEKHLNKNNPSLAITYNNIAATHQEMRNYTEAVTFYKKSLSVKEKGLNATNPSLATAHAHIGRVYQMMKNYPEALVSYQQAYKIQKANLPKDHPELIQLETVIEKLKECS